MSRGGHDRVSSAGTMVGVQLRCAWRGRVRDESSGAANLARDGRMRATLGDGWSRPYRHGGGKKALKLKLDWVPFKAGWGRVARQLCDRGNNMTNRLEMISP